MPNTLVDQVALNPNNEAQEIVRTWWPHFARQPAPPMERPSSAAGASAQSAELFQLIAQNVSDYAIFAQDTNGSILSWNPGVAAVLGYEEENFLGKHVSIIFTPEDIERGEVDEQMREARVRGRALDRKWHVRQDSSRFWANGLLMPLWDGENKLLGYARIIRDDTEQKRIEEKRDETLASERKARRHAELLRESLERSKREKDDFLALLAHELRNPLNAILGWLAVLNSGMADQRLLVRGLRAIETSARSQDRLIEDVFDFASISSGNLRFNSEAMLLNEAVIDAIESARPAAQAKNISLDSSVASESIIFVGDADRIKQAIINILANAIKFTPIDGHILVTLERERSDIHIIVEDNGQGFSAEFGSRIFDRYTQADKTSVRGRSGLGLGLPLVREIVERHGGRVTAESPGQGLGATFTIYLPLSRTPSQAALSAIS
jgi:PAS domain S-box-containing protein